MLVSAIRATPSFDGQEGRRSPPVLGTGAPRIRGGRVCLPTVRCGTIKEPLADGLKPSNVFRNLSYRAHNRLQISMQHLTNLAK